MVLQVEHRISIRRVYSNIDNGQVAGGEAELEDAPCHLARPEVACIETFCNIVNALVSLSISVVLCDTGDCPVSSLAHVLG